MNWDELAEWAGRRRRGLVSGSCTESLCLKVGMTQHLSSAVCSPALCCFRRASGGWLDGSCYCQCHCVFMGLVCTLWGCCRGLCSDPWSCGVFSQEKFSHRKPCPGALSTHCLPMVMRGQMSLSCPMSQGMPGQCTHTGTSGWCEGWNWLCRYLVGSSQSVPNAQGFRPWLGVKGLVKQPGVALAASTNPGKSHITFGASCLCCPWQGCNTYAYSQFRIIWLFFVWAFFS